VRYVPNLLSAARLLAVVPIVWLILINTPATYAWATVIYFFSAVTDTVDGRIARHYHLVSRLGVFLDLTADKGFVISILVALVQVGLVPAWITIVIVLREFVVQGLRTLAAADSVVIPAGNLGKQKTFLSLLGIGGILLGRAFDGHTWFLLGLATASHGPQSFGDWLLFTANAVLLLAVVWTILSAVEYMRGGWKFLVGSATGRS
jgi:CDP-diacylglycerol---glycerol-3-phosphate 3-phosphatidyltransferase